MAKYIIPTFKWFVNTYEEFKSAKMSERDRASAEKLLELGYSARELPTYLNFTEFIFDLAHCKNDKERMSDICRLAGYSGREAELGKKLCVSESTFIKWVCNSDNANHRNPPDHTFYHAAYIIAINILTGDN